MLLKYKYQLELKVLLKIKVKKDYYSLNYPQTLPFMHNNE